MKLMRPLIILSCVAVLSAVAADAAQLDRPTLGSYVQGHAKVVTIVVAGPSGAPAGFTIQWMRFSDFRANGNRFHDEAHPDQAEASFEGVPTLNTWGGLLTTFALEPSAAAAVEIGDLFDETGVSKNATAATELAKETTYIFRARANADGVNEASDWSNHFLVDTGQNVNCTFTQGYWKTHPDAWPVDSLMLGTVMYSQAQLLSILHQPAQGNGLVILAHQLIAVLLNIANGADDTDVAMAVTAAQALIGGLVVPPVGSGYLAPSSTSSLTQTLDDYNNGIIGPGHCGTVGVEPTTWSRTKGAWR